MGQAEANQTDHVDLTPTMTEAQPVLAHMQIVANRMAQILMAGDCAVELIEEMGASDLAGPNSNCIHESAHVCMRLILQEPIAAVTAGTNGGGATLADLNLDRSLPVHQQTDEESLDEIDKALVECGYPRLDRPRLRFETTELLVRHWDAVERFAQALLSRMIGAEEARLSESVIRKLWQFHVEGLGNSEKGE